MQKKTRWWSRLKSKLKWFRPHGHPQRIADASRSPEPGAPPCAEQAAGSSSINNYARHAPQPAVAFVAPPSSPASSVLTSESPSPVVLLNANNACSSSYSSPTASIFAIGPYAREPQQLVSPPAFSASAGLTEPSTAPVTPPPESGLHLLATTPSSPEVPFARFLWSSAAADQQPHCSPGGMVTEGFLHAYQLQPGSPVLVSPGSTSSSPPPWNMQQQHWVGTHSDGGRVPIKDESKDDEVATGGGEFVFGSNADAAAGERFAGGEVGARGDATEQWPFLLAHTHS